MASCWWIFDLRLVFGLGLLLVDLVCVFWFDCFGEPLWTVLVCVVPLVIVFDFIVSDVGLDFGWLVLGLLDFGVGVWFVVF